MERYNYSEGPVALLFLIIPTIFIALGLLFFSYPIPEEIRVLLSIPLFTSLTLLGVGFFLKKEEIANKLKLIGWVVFSFFWSTKINELYFGVDGDFVNVFLCISGVFLLFYMAYHEWLSIKKKEQVECLNWFAGVASLAGFIYFVVELTPLAPWLIYIVTAHSGWLLNLFTGNVTVDGVWILYEGVGAVRIIFACTAVQSMVIFIGMILPLKKVDINRKIYGLLITILPIYFLNMVRNALVAYLLAEDITSFYIAHNIIGKGGSLIALVALLLVVIKIVPEVFDEIVCLTDLYKRNGPLERFIGKSFGRKK